MVVNGCRICQLLGAPLPGLAALPAIPRAPAMAGASPSSCVLLGGFLNAFIRSSAKGGDSLASFALRGFTEERYMKTLCKFHWTSCILGAHFLSVLSPLGPWPRDLLGLEKINWYRGWNGALDSGKWLFKAWDLCPVFHSMPDSSLQCEPDLSFPQTYSERDRSFWKGFNSLKPWRGGQSLSGYRWMCWGSHSPPCLSSSD